MDDLGVLKYSGVARTAARSLSRTLMKSAYQESRAAASQRWGAWFTAVALLLFSLRPILASTATACGATPDQDCCCLEELAPTSEGGCCTQDSSRLQEEQESASSGEDQPCDCRTSPADPTPRTPLVSPTDQGAARSGYADWIARGLQPAVLALASTAQPTEFSLPPPGWSRGGDVTRISSLSTAACFALWNEGCVPRALAQLGIARA